MADVKISQLPTATSLTTADLLPVVQSGVTKQATTRLIWNQQPRMINVIANPNFEIDQINAGTLVANSRDYACDRWWMNNAGTMQVSTQQISGVVTVPGTSSIISNSYLRATLTTQQASLGATDGCGFGHSVDAALARMLYGGVHSVSLLVRSSVASLKFSVAMTDVVSTWGLTKLCTMGTANTWTLITLPNLPVWTGSGTFNTTPGISGYIFYITLSAGTTYIGAPDSWISGYKFGATGMDNFASKAVNSTFDIAFVQHEPGAECTTLVAKPWQENYEECLRYYCKTYNYNVLPGTITSMGMRALISVAASTGAHGNLQWAKPMVKPPGGFHAYNHATGAKDGVQDSGLIDHGTVQGVDVGETGMRAITFTTNTPAGVSLVYFHYVADCRF